MEAQVSGYGVYRTEYHVVWIPKYRRRILNPSVGSYLSRLFPKVLRSLPGCEIIEQNMQVDHIHMVVVIPLRYAVSAVIGQMKQYRQVGCERSLRGWGKCVGRIGVVTVLDKPLLVGVLMPSSVTIRADFRDRLLLASQLLWT